MREILFRGKRICDDEWIEGFFGRYHNGESDVACISIRSNGFFGLSSYEVDPETVGQYTGLTDKNGNKIFEGDIVQNISERKKGIVQWFEEHAAFLIYCQSENTLYWLYDNDFSNLEVIGNIHDNPELIGGGDE